MIWGAARRRARVDAAVAATRSGVPSATQSARPIAVSSTSSRAVERAQIPSFDAFADGVRQWR